MCSCALRDVLELRCFGSVTPGHQLVEPSDLVIGDSAKHPRQPSLGIDVVQLGGFDKGIGDRHAFAPALGACKHPILAACSRFPFILPMSGRFTEFTTDGTLILGLGALRCKWAKKSNPSGV